MYYFKNNPISYFIITPLLIFFISTASACRFPEIYIHHHAYPVNTDIDGGQNSWFNPMINGQYEGCGFGIPDRHSFSLRAGETHKTSAFKYYAVIANSNSVCRNHDIYGKDHPLTKRYAEICKHSSSNGSISSGIAPGICLVYESQVISWAFRDCINRMNMNDKLDNIDEEYPTTNSLPKVDGSGSCIGSAGGLAGCFPYPLPPSPPPFCSDKLENVPQTPKYLPVCTKDGHQRGTSVDICAEPVDSITGNSTHFRPCARVTFENHIKTSTDSNSGNWVAPLCIKHPNYSGCLNINSGDVKASSNIDDTTFEAVYEYLIRKGYVELIYTQTISQSGDTPITQQTRRNVNMEPSRQKPYGYNFSEYEDLCYDFNNNTYSQATITDIYGSQRTFRTCRPQEDDDQSFCIEELITHHTGDKCLDSNKPFCFSRPNIEKPKVTFCSDKTSPNTPNDYCLETNFNGTRYQFTKQQKNNDIFGSIETNNNFDTPTKKGICTRYYDSNNATYTQTGNEGCTFYGGLEYQGINYKSGATKFCLLGYQSGNPKDMVCTNADLDPNAIASKRISDRKVPNRTAASPLQAGDCCTISSDESSSCTYIANKQIRPKNPIEEGLCVDIMLFDFQNCNDFQASSEQEGMTSSEASDLRAQCSTYKDFCSAINKDNNSYVNADTCNKNYIDCLSSGLATNNVENVSTDNICRFYKIK